MQREYDQPKPTMALVKRGWSNQKSRKARVVFSTPLLPDGGFLLLMNLTTHIQLVEIAKLWKGHEGVNYETTTTENLLTLIKDAVEHDHKLLADEEKACLQAISDRDDVQETLNQIYRLITGHSPEWSNHFQYEDAVAEINERIAGMKSVTKV